MWSKANLLARGSTIIVGIETQVEELSLIRRYVIA